MVFQSKDKVFKILFWRRPQRFLNYFKIMEIFVRFLRTEFIDENGHKNLMDIIMEVRENRAIDFEPHSSRIDKAAISTFHRYNSLATIEFGMSVKTVILALLGHENDFKYGKLLDNLRFTPQIIWFKDMDGNKHLNDITEKNSNKERLSSDDIFDLILLHLMVPEEYCEVYFEKTCMITDEVIADEDDLKLVRECQAWFLDETVKDEKRKRRIKEVLKMSEYVPSIFLDYEEKGIEKGIEKGMKKGKLEGKLEMVIEMLKEGYSMKDILKVSHLSSLDIKKAAELANINIKF